MSRASRTHQRPLRTLTVFAAVTAFMFAIMAFNNIWTPKLGLDLKGGTTITLTATNVTGSGAIDPDSLEMARTIIQQRVDAVGVGESEVTTSGDDQIIVAVPNVDPDTLTEMVGQTAQLNFRPVISVDLGSDAEPTGQAGEDSNDADSSLPKPLEEVPEADETADPAPSQSEVGQPLDTKEALAYEPTQQDMDAFEAFTCGDEVSDRVDRPLITCDREGGSKFLLGPMVIPGDMLTQASAGMRQGSVTWVVNLQLNDEGARLFEQATGELAKNSEPQNSFAIVLDSEVVSYPRVSAAIPGGGAEISGSFTQQSAMDLANVLKFGALPLAFDLSEVATVSPTLGGEQLEAGVTAGIVGLILVMLYAILYYRGLSVVVVSSLVIAGLLTYASVVLLGHAMGYALNLPGIAGIIVAIGVTADSFVIFFERIRDEVREGRSIRSAIETGWEGSRRTIVVADAVSLLSAVVLFVLAIGGVKGFAFTLGLTTVIDVLIVFFFTKPLMTLLGRTRFFGEGRRFSGFEADHMGSRRQTPQVGVRRPSTSAKGA